MVQPKRIEQWMYLRMSISKHKKELSSKWNCYSEIKLLIGNFMSEIY